MFVVVKQAPGNNTKEINNLKYFDLSAEEYWLAEKDHLEFSGLECPRRVRQTSVSVATARRKALEGVYYK